MLELLIYMSGVIIMMIAFAIRTKNADIGPAIILSIVWPLSILLMLIIKCFWAVGWDFDIVGGDKWFGYRKPTNPRITGFAVTALKLEFQFWNKKLKD